MPFKILKMTKEDEKQVNIDSPSWVKLAALGDSTTALFCSFALLVVSVVVSLAIDDAPEVDLEYQALGPLPKIDPPKIFQFQDGMPLVSDEIRKAFQTDGVIAIRGLLDDDLLKLLDKASANLVEEKRRKSYKPRGALSGGKVPRPKQFYLANHSLMLQQDPESQSLDNNPFLKVSLQSRIPMVAADLLQMEPKETLRVLRDIFLAKDEDQFICGWHVDDTGFWPATAEAPGVNAWLALDDMPLEQGGGFALAVGSHTAPWREEAYNVTGSTHTFPKEGFTSASDMIENRMGEGTCNVKTAANHIYRRMEETKRIYEVQRGDVIFSERWLFHRTVAFDKQVIKNRRASGKEHLVSRRYSIRYGPGSSKIPRGWGTEISVMWDQQNGK